MNSTAARTTGSRAQRLRRAFAVCLAAVVLTMASHVATRALVRMTPPRVDLPRENSRTSWVIERAGVRAVHLEGPPEAIGAGHARLLRRAMIDDEEQLWNEFSRFVPWSIARTAIEDFSLVRYRGLDLALPYAIRKELAAESIAMQPDPLAWHLETYHRLVLLHAVLRHRPGLRALSDRWMHEFRSRSFADPGRSCRCRTDLRLRRGRRVRPRQGRATCPR